MMPDDKEATKVKITPLDLSHLHRKAQVCLLMMDGLKMLMLGYGGDWSSEGRKFPVQKGE
jgi:hypothetical protein